MANLDDFFKKKDGKKSKGKKFAVTNLSLSSTDQAKNGKAKQEKPTSFNLNHALLGNENDLFSSQALVGPMYTITLIDVSQNTDEWKDFVEEKKDYTGLKIQNLTLYSGNNKSSVGERELEEETEVDDNGQTVVKKKQPNGPWKVIESKTEAKEPEKKVEEKPKPPEPAPVEKAYLPPHMRTQMSASNTRAPQTRKEQFPTLGSTVPGQTANQGKRSKTKTET